MTKKYKFYTDPGHGWLAVKRKELIELGIIDKISSYSYQKGSTVYCEEDADLSLFAKAKGFYSTSFFDNTEQKHTNNRSPIRSYDRFVFNPDTDK